MLVSARAFSNSWMASWFRCCHSSAVQPLVDVGLIGSELKSALEAFHSRTIAVHFSQQRAGVGLVERIQGAQLHGARNLAERFLKPAHALQVQRVTGVNHGIVGTQFEGAAEVLLSGGK